jgi:hypothetical protein
MQEGLKELEVLLDPYDWFYEVVAEARRYVVYVTYMEGSQDTIIPDFVHGHQVVVHFASSAPGVHSNYISKVSASGLTALVEYTTQSILDKSHMVLVSTEHDLTNDIRVLTNELDRLEKQCGSNILQDIFYETHDGNNAVTNLGDRYPEVKVSMQKLYNKYGFDTIYNELDG